VASQTELVDVPRNRGHADLNVHPRPDQGSSGAPGTIAGNFLVNDGVG
jgi:hypothetical protein